MGLSADPLDTIRDLLYDNWSGSDPTKTELTNADSSAKCYIGERPLNVRPPLIVVRDDVCSPAEKAGGPEAWKLFNHYIWIDVYATDSTELYNMTQRVGDILEDNRLTPGGGMHHIKFASNWRPKNWKESGHGQLLARSLRFCLVYWRLP